jgi:hypothetical protein
MLAASRWRVRPQRLDGEEDDMSRIMKYLSVDNASFASGS